MKEQNNILWWKVREAALYAIGSSTDSAEEFAESLNSAQFINNALIQDINTGKKIEKNKGFILARYYVFEIESVGLCFQVCQDCTC